MNPCPEHGTAKLKPGKGGGMFCASRMPDGSWCTFQSAGNGVSPTGATPSPVSGHDRRVIAAMDFASRLYQGQGADGEARAMLCVRTALSLFS